MSVTLVVECPGFEPLQSGKVTEEEIWKAIPERNGLWTAGKLVTEGTLQYYELATDMDGQKCVWKTKEEAEKYCTVMLAVDKALRRQLARLESCSATPKNPLTGKTFSNK